MSNYLFSNWQTADSEAKASLLNEIINHLGNDWKIDGEQLLHTPSEKRFAFIPAGWMVQGLSPEKLYELCTKRKYFDFEDSSWPEEITKMRPSKKVWVYPFLISLETENKEIDADSEFGFSLPSESELEWVFSNCGQTSFVAEKIATDKKKKKKSTDDFFDEPFGIQYMVEKSAQCIDDWHETLHNKPENSLPWGTGRGVAKDVHVCWQDEEEEIIAWHVAYRGECSGSRDHFDVIRLNELFPEISGQPVPESTVFVKDVLENGKAAQKKALLGMFDLLAYTPSEDTPAIFEQLLNNLETDPKLKPKMLKAASKMACGIELEERLSKNSPFSPARELLADAVDNNINILFPLLEMSNTAVTKASVAGIFSVSSKPEVYDAFLELYKAEKNKTVIEALHLASAFYAKKNAVDTLLFELFENPKDKTADYFKTLLQNIKDKPDYEQLITPMKNGEVDSEYTFWFITLLLTCDIEKEKLGIELAKIAFNLLNEIEDLNRNWTSVYPLLEIIDKAFPLVFPKFNAEQIKAIKAQKQASFLFYNELTETQKEMLDLIVQIMESMNHAWHWERMRSSGIPSSEEGIKILMGKSSSPYAQKVTYNGMNMTAFYAISTIIYGKDRKEYKPGLQQFLSQFDLDSLIEMIHTSLKIYIESEIRSVILDKIEEDRPKAAEFFKKKIENQIPSEESLRFISYSVLAFKEDENLRSWLLNNCNTEYDVNDYLLGSEYYSIKEETVVKNINELGRLMIEILRAKDIEPYFDQFLLRKFAHCITPQTDIKLVMGMLSLQVFCSTKILMPKLETGTSTYAGAYKSRNYTAEEMKPFYEAIPKEFFGKDKWLAFEKLWQMYIEDDTFRL